MKCRFSSLVLGRALALLSMLSVSDLHHAHGQDPTNHADFINPDARPDGDALSIDVPSNSLNTAVLLNAARHPLSRRLLFQPSSRVVSIEENGIDWNLNSPFPSHSISNVNPFPLHVSLQALEPPQRFQFEVFPALRPGAELIGFDWARNRTIGTLGDGGSLEWSDVLPKWIQYIAPTSSSDRGFVFVLTSPSSSGDRTTVYSSPAPTLIHFHAIVQYQNAVPPQPEEEDASEPDESNSSPEDASAAAAASASSSSSLSPRLVLVEEVQSFSLLVSMSILPPFTTRLSDMASYIVTQTPNLLDVRNRVTNRRSLVQASKGLQAYRMDWRDEVVYSCANTVGSECDVCAIDSSAPTTSSSSPFCAFPAGSFFNAQSGALRVRNPIHILGNLQVNEGATLEFSHTSNTASSVTRVITTVSVVDCRDQHGIAQPIVNEGVISIRKGHVVIYSSMIGRGAIHVHNGGSVEFISLQPHSSVFYFNHTTVQSVAASNTLGGINMEEFEKRSSIGRRLLQTEDLPLDESSVTGVQELDSSTGFDIAAASSTNSSASMNSTSSTSFQDSGSNSVTNDLSSTGVISSFNISILSSTGASNSSSTTPSTAATSATESSSSSSTAASPPKLPPSSSSTNNKFQPHPAATLVSFGGGVLFSHGRFVFLAPFQSSIFDEGQAAGAQNGYNRLAILPTAHVIFDQPPFLPVINGTNVALPADHLLSFTLVCNLGYLSVWNSTCNFTSVLFFKSFGLMNLTSSSRVFFEISDNSEWNRISGWNGWRGVPMMEEERARLKEVIQMLSTPVELVTALNSSDTQHQTDAIDSPVENEQSVQASATADSSSISTSLVSLATASSSPLVNRCTSGGVGLLVDGFLLFRSGKLSFGGGLIARGLSHVFIKKGSEWRIDVEPSGDYIADRTAASFLHFSGIELSLDGVWNLVRGHLILLTPLLQIEGHGQLIALGSDTRVHIDNHKINRDIYLRMLSGATSEPESITLVENPEAESDPNADLYSLAPIDVTARAPSAIPSYRECLIAPCLLSSGCQSFFISDGATLTLAPLTFLHFLPRASSTVETTALEGGSIILDSNVRYVGNSFVQNSTDSSAMVNGFATLTAVVHIGNDSSIEMMDGRSTDRSSTIPIKPAVCVLAFGNLTGNGQLTCRSQIVQLDSVLMYPTFLSPSPFSPTVYLPPLASSVPVNSSIFVASPAPMFRFGSDVTLTERTTTMLDILGFHSISSVRVSGSATLGGVLVLNASLHRWPFEITLGTNRSSKSKDGTTESAASGIQTNVTASGSLDSNSSANIPSTANPLPVGVDSALLIYATRGLLPLNAARHFSSVSLSALYEILPAGWSLDLTYQRTKLTPDDVAALPSPIEIEIESQLWLTSYAPDYQPNTTTANANQTTSGAQPDLRTRTGLQDCPIAIALVVGVLGTLMALV